MIKNLLEETIEKLKENGKSFDDVNAICGNDFQISKADFIKYSNIEYDGGFGATEVATDLLIIGEDFWLERHEYDGSECWRFKKLPQYKDLPIKSINALTMLQARKNGECHWGDETLLELQLTDEQYEERDVT